MTRESQDVTRSSVDAELVVDGSVRRRRCLRRLKWVVTAVESAPTHTSKIELSITQS